MDQHQSGQAAPRPYRRADEETWTRARADFAAGTPVAVIAERHELGARNVRRRALEEGWKRSPPAFAGVPRSDEEELAETPMLGPFVAAHTYEVGELLLKPSPALLARFAFRRAAEAGAVGRPAEALSWVRLVESVGRAGDRLDRATRRFTDADYLRALYADEMRDAFAEQFEEDPDADAAPAETDGEATPGEPDE